MCRRPSRQRTSTATLTCATQLRRAPRTMRRHTTRAHIPPLGVGYKKEGYDERRNRNACDSSLGCSVVLVVMTTQPRAIAICIGVCVPRRPALGSYAGPSKLGADRSGIGRTAYDPGVNAWQKRVILSRETYLRTLLQSRASVTRGMKRLGTPASTRTAPISDG